MIYKATLKKQFHPKAYKSPDDCVRCSDCGDKPEPCEQCKSHARILAAIVAEREKKK